MLTLNNHWLLSIFLISSAMLLTFHSQSPVDSVATNSMILAKILAAKAKQFGGLFMLLIVHRLTLSVSPRLFLLVSHRLTYQWTDLSPRNASSKVRLGFTTQQNRITFISVHKSDGHQLHSSTTESIMNSFLKLSTPFTALSCLVNAEDVSYSKRHAKRQLDSTGNYNMCESSSLALTTTNPLQHSSISTMFMLI